jgi:hypothetical protein
LDGSIARAFEFAKPGEITPQGCGKRGADVQPDFNWSKQPVAMMGYR